MTAIIVTLTQAVVEQLNAASFSQTVLAERHYQPRFDLSEMDILKVSVVPRGLSLRPLDRERHAYEYEIDVAVQKRLSSELQAIDDLLELVEEIAEHFKLNPVIEPLKARCTEIRNAPIYASEHLLELRQFTSVITLIYRDHR
jgi:hypothetical protein